MWQAVSMWVRYWIAIVGILYMSLSSKSAKQREEMCRITSQSKRDVYIIVSEVLIRLIYSTLKCKVLKRVSLISRQHLFYTFCYEH